MSLTVLAVAAIHALPVVLVAMATRSRFAVTLAAMVMGIVALAFGSGRYDILDLAVVAIAYFFALGMCKPSLASANSYTEHGASSAWANTSKIPRNFSEGFRYGWEKAAQDTLARRNQVRQMLIEKYHLNVSSSGEVSRMTGKDISEIPTEHQTEYLPTLRSGIRRFTVHEEATAYAKKLAEQSGQSIAIQRGTEDEWFVGTGSAKQNLKSEYFRQGDMRKRQEDAGDLDKSFDNDLETQLIVTEMHDDKR